MFNPSREYVLKSVLEPEVLNYLARHKYRKSLYMIVGIQIGFNAKIVHKRTHKKGGGLNVSIPGALTGIPVDLGAGYECSATNHRYERKRISSFVFAYRLREVRYYKKNNSTTDVEFTKGAELHDLYGNNHVLMQPDVKEEVYLGTQDEIRIDGLFREDSDEGEHDTVIIDGCIMVSSMH